MTTFRGFRRLSLLVVILLGLAPCIVRPGAVDAAILSFAVTSAADGHDAAPGNGVCADASGHCTLRAATEEANALPAGSSIYITLPARHFLLTLGELDLISNTVVISGTGANTTVVDAGNQSRVLQVFGGSTVYLVLLSVTGGSVVGADARGAPQGGGILNGGNLTVIGSSIWHNHTSSFHPGYYDSRGGGGLYNTGAVTLTNSAIISNTATDQGGGIWNNGTLKVTSSTIISNTSAITSSSQSYGGGLYNCGSWCGGIGAVTLTSSVISHNTSSFLGGALFSDFYSTVTLTNSLISSNTASGAGGGLYNAGLMTVTNSVISSNSVGNSNTPSYSSRGGGIANQGTITLSNSTISRNTALFQDGGGIDNSGALTLNNSTISRNTAARFGGGINNSAASSSTPPATLTNSAIISNTATDQGGGIYNVGGVMALTNSTLSGNGAAQGGGYFSFLAYSFLPARLTSAYSTISNNTATSQGGGLDSEGGATADVNGTILAANTPANCAGTLPTEAQGYNLDSGTSCGLSQPTDISTTPPLLGPLAYNGGPTQTQALLSGSLAIDHGGTSAHGCPATDQRGVSRPQGPACDIGAYERVP